ncbi:unnamed protein product [Arabidopsis thaliana]|uniref:(thale cress) hypothetical protein n=1 Tax=Arabidopsis thaliana TaxID=3702 RepID=A0A7G2E9Z4_ARATH|nr:unnamed protein product [Arabidopsis thaliana]
MNPKMTYVEFHNHVSSEFELNAENWKPKISYRLPGQLSVFLVNTRSPVTVATNMVVRNFRRVRESEPQITLLLSLEALPYLVDGVSVDLLAVCGKEKSQEDEMLQCEGGQSSKCITYIQSAGSNGAECSTRNNILQSAASLLNGSNSVVRTYTLEYETGSDVHNSGIIEVGWPTVVEECEVKDDTDCIVLEMNENVSEQFLGTNVSDEEDEPLSEDMRMLIEVEELERVELAKQKINGKRKLFDSGLEPPDGEDILLGSSHPSSIAQPQEAEIVGPSTAKEDINKSVPNYYRDHVGTTDVEVNTTEDNDSLLVSGGQESKNCEVLEGKYVNGMPGPRAVDIPDIVLGIKYMRKVVLVDGTAIKHKFKGVLLTASMQDANFMLSAIMPDAKNLVIVSDRHASIYGGIRQVYPKVFHGACAVHIERNVRVKFPKKGVSNLVSKASRAFNETDLTDFRAFNTEMWRRNSGCADYLAGIPKEHWTQAYCEAKRYNLTSCNIVEALNSALGKIIELPIVTLVEGIRTKLMKWFCVRRAKALKLKDRIIPNAHKLILRHHAGSNGLAVLPISPWTFQVNNVEGTVFYVGLQKKACSRRQFDKLQIPRCHALVAAAQTKIHIPTLVGNWFKVCVWEKYYAEFIKPVSTHGKEEVDGVIEESEFIPRDHSIGHGGRMKRRFPSVGNHMGGKGREKVVINVQDASNRNITGHMS